MLVAGSSAASVPAAVREVLDEYRREHGVEVRLWRAEAGVWRVVHGPAEGPLTDPPPTTVELAGGEFRVELDGSYAEQHAADTRFLAAVLARVLRHEHEIRAMSNEMAQRYEEITLLYSISETLGSVISLEAAAGTILEQVLDTIGARRAALWVHDPAGNQLYLAAAVGLTGQSGPVRLDDPTSVTAKVFREHQPVIMDPDDVFPRGPHDRGITKRGYFLSVPVRYSPPQGETRTVGVINLVGRTSDEPFDSGDVNLLLAIASQVGAAVENGRLVAESLRRERLVRELELAHDLQLKLLPSAERFKDYAEIAARCLPADTVGGDFYHLFRLSGGRLGVMIGDVSSHGFSAALIMALTMSAVAIHASEGHPPGEVLRRIHRTLINELETTEMYLTLFYAVIDPADGTVCYANAGHHHAFRIGADGAALRLDATSPPFGMVDLAAYEEASTAWTPDEDLLLLFTDGLSDAIGAGEVGGEEAVLDAVRAHGTDDLDALLERLFELPRPSPAPVPLDDRTAVLVRK